jgi:peptidoglycan-associated lipoprotein
MSRMARVSAGALIAITVCVPATAAAQSKLPSHVRVLTSSERILRWLGPEADVILVADQGTTLEVLDFDRDKESYWVVLPPDLHGTRKAGWIRANAVEAAVASTQSDAAAPIADVAPPVSPSGSSLEAQAQAAMAPSTSVPATSEEKVTLSVRRDAPAASSTPAAGAKTAYTFEDVHFDRDHSALRSEDLDRLHAVAAALKDDPSLVVTIEGHTCSLGTGPYNLALGTRRADAVKDYLVSAGVPASRLVTISQGETHAEHDNSREETRRLNRRVVLVPKPR